MEPLPYSGESKEIRTFLVQLVTANAGDEKRIAEYAGQLLDRYVERLKATDVPAASTLPARYAMAVLIDERVRDLPSISTSAWLAAAHMHVFDRRELTTDSLRQFADVADAQGAEYEDFKRFLDDMIVEIEGKRQHRAGIPRAPARIFGFAFMAYLVSLAGYVVLLDYRYHADLFAGFAAQIAELPEDRSPDRLAAIARLYHETERASGSAPLSRLLTLPFWESGPRAEAVYRTEAAATVPDALREAIGEALETEGDGLALYDTLRVWAILTGRTDWSAAYIAGWTETRADRLGLGSLADHMEFLDGPEPRLAVPDQELLDQAGEFAVETTEADRAFLELERLPEMRALGRWQSTDHIAEIGDVFIFRSGRSLDAGVPHLYTRQGWDLTKSGALEDAVRIARIEAAKLFPRPGASSINTREQVFDRLQDATVRYWQAWLEDLRVRPFVDEQSAIVVSGALSRRNSALLQVIETIWTEAGGDDPTRPVANASRIEATLGAALLYVRSPEFDQMRALFSSLNVALATMDQDETRGIDALMGLQDRAEAGAVLKSAPSLVAQIAEDVLAQTSATHAEVLSNPLTREWQTRVYPICQRAIDGRYPFHRGDDADLMSLDAFFGTGGALPRFYAQYAERNLDTSSETWRWTADVRLSGVKPESAVFLQRAMTVAQILYGEDQVFGTSFDMAPLAMRGRAIVRLGGVNTPLESDGVALTWPGQQPLDGMSVTFSDGGPLARVEETGLWGLLRVLDQTSIRQRNEGRRQLVDLRVDGGRIFFELLFSSALNPVAGKGHFHGISCPPVL